MQRDAFPGMPHFMAPDEIPTMLRSSTRKEKLVIHVISLAIIADNETDFREFIALVKKRRAALRIAEQPIVYSSQRGEGIVRFWRDARRAGAARAGGDATAAKAEAEFWVKFAVIKDRWHLPSKKQNANEPLLAEAGTSRNTVKSHLGFTREEWQRMPDAKRNRILENRYEQI